MIVVEVDVATIFIAMVLGGSVAVVTLLRCWRRCASSTEESPGHDLMAGLLGVHQIPDAGREFLLECLAAFPGEAAPTSSA